MKSSAFIDLNSAPAYKNIAKRSTFVTEFNHENALLKTMQNMYIIVPFKLYVPNKFLMHCTNE